MTVPKLVKTLPNGLKVGIFGLLGKNAAQVAPTAAPFTFDPIATTATAMVSELRNQDHVDLVIALSHSGINQAGQGEDAELAASRARHRRDPERAHPRRAGDGGHRRQDGDHPDRPLRRAPGQAGAHGQRAGGGTRSRSTRTTCCQSTTASAGDAPTQARIDEYKPTSMARSCRSRTARPVAQTSLRRAHRQRARPRSATW